MDTTAIRTRFQKAKEQERQRQERASVTPPGRLPKECVTSPAPRPEGVRPEYTNRVVPTVSDVVFSGYPPATVRLLLAALEATTEKGAFARGRGSLGLDSALSKDGVKEVMKAMVAEGQVVCLRTGGPLRTEEGERIPGRYRASVYLWTWTTPIAATYPPMGSTEKDSVGGYVAAITERTVRGMILWHDAWRHPSTLSSAMLTLMTLAISEREWGTTELAEATGQAQRSVERHMSFLDKTGWVLRVKEGRTTRNWATDPSDWSALLDEQAERAGTVGRRRGEIEAMRAWQEAADAEYAEWKALRAEMDENLMDSRLPEMLEAMDQGA